MTETQTKPVTTAKPQTPAKPKETKPRKERVNHDTTVFNADFLANPLQASDDDVRKTAPARERSTEQRAMDAIVPKLHTAWVSAGRPSQWNKMRSCIAKYPVNPKDAAALKYLIRRACDLHGVRPKFGTAVRTQDGREVVAFAVMDKRPRETSNK